MEALLAKPFASKRYELYRKLGRLMVAEQIGAESIVKALAEVEPNVPWTADVLEARAKAYAALNHPMAAKAASDWLWFQRHQATD